MFVVLSCLLAHFSTDISSALLIHFLLTRRQNSNAHPFPPVLNSMHYVDKLCEAVRLYLLFSTWGNDQKGNFEEPEWNEKTSMPEIVSTILAVLFLWKATGENRLFRCLSSTLIHKQNNSMRQLNNFPPSHRKCVGLPEPLLCSSCCHLPWFMSLTASCFSLSHSNVWKTYCRGSN